MFCTFIFNNGKIILDDDLKFSGKPDRHLNMIAFFLVRAHSHSLRRVLYTFMYNVLE